MNILDGDKVLGTINTHILEISDMYKAYKSFNEKNNIVGEGFDKIDIHSIVPIRLKNKKVNWEYVFDIVNSAEILNDNPILDHGNKYFISISISLYIARFFQIKCLIDFCNEYLHPYLNDYLYVHVNIHYCPDENAYDYGDMTSKDTLKGFIRRKTLKLLYCTYYEGLLKIDPSIDYKSISYTNIEKIQDAYKIVISKFDEKCPERMDFTHYSGWYNGTWWNFDITVFKYPDNKEHLSYITLDDIVSVNDEICIHHYYSSYNDYLDCLLDNHVIMNFNNEDFSMILALNKILYKHGSNFTYTEREYEKKITEYIDKTKNIYDELREIYEDAIDFDDLILYNDTHNDMRKIKYLYYFSDNYKEDNTIKENDYLFSILNKYNPFNNNRIIYDKITKLNDIAKEFSIYSSDISYVKKISKKIKNDFNYVMKNYNKELVEKKIGRYYDDLFDLEKNKYIE